MPNSVEATPQTRLIGLALNDADTAFYAAEDGGLKPEWMTGVSCIVWEMLVEMYTGKQPIDVHFVAEHAKAKGVDIPEEYLGEASRLSPSRHNGAEQLIADIRRGYITEQLRMIGAGLMEPGQEVVPYAMSAVDDITRLLDTGPNTQDLDTIFSQIDKEWDDAAKGILHGIPMPWKTIYERTGGVDPGWVCLLVSHGGVGKSSAGLQWAKHLAQENIPSLVLPLEDGRYGAYKRLAGMVSGVSSFDLRIGRAAPAERELAQRGLRSLKDIPLYVEDSAKTVGEIPILVQRYKRKNNIMAVFVDAIKDVRTGLLGNEADNASMEMLKSIAERFGVAVIASHHVRKPPNTLKGKNLWEMWNITQSDVRGSTRLWDDPRMVLALQKYPESDGRNTAIDEFYYQLHVLKANHGLPGLRQAVRRDRTLMWHELDD